MMSEGRRTQVVLLDERRVELIVQPKLLGSGLLDLVASYFKLKEKEFFGLAFFDETNHYNWLQLDKKVLDNDFQSKSGVLTLYFRVQFFPESINQLRDSITIELFYLQAKESVFKGDIEADSETIFELGAYALQATEGDYTSDQRAHRVLKKLPVLPHFTLREHPSLAYCEERILFYYKRLGGLSTGQCIVCYMQLVEGLPTYGVHYFEVKDKGLIPWWLGFSFKGVCQYDQVDRVTPRKIFQWRQLQNIYYRDKKFSIEVTDPRREVRSFNLYRDALEEPEECFDELSDAISDPTTQVSVSRRSFGVNNATVHSWYGHPTLIRSMWTMAVNQHQFYLDRKHNKDRYASMQRTFKQIANDLTKSTNSLTSSQTSDMSSDPGQPSTQGTTSDSSENNNIKEKDMDKDKDNTSRELLAIAGESAKKDMVMALRARRNGLEDRLRQKMEELKKICVSEAELTGELPLEYPRKPGEEHPKIKRRVATAFTLSAKVVNAGDTSCSQETQVLNQLESELEIQSKITIAARKLADDPTINKKVRKTRRESYKNSAQKLDVIEKKLLVMKQDLGLVPSQDQSSFSPEDKFPSKTLPRKRSIPSSPQLLRNLGGGGDRGRSKEKKDRARTRSKSVPRQMFENAWRSPSLGRKKDKVPMRPVTPVEIYTDTAPVVNATIESQHRDKPKQNHSSLQQHEVLRRNQYSYDSALNSMASLDVNHHSDSGSLRDDSSTHSAGSTRSQPEGYVTNSRTSLARMAQSRQSNFSTSLGDVSAVVPNEPNLRSSPRRNKPPIQRRIDRGPPPVYNSPAKLRSISQSGRYFESPEDTLGRSDMDAPKLKKHASSMHDLQYALQGHNLPALNDDELEYHQQATSLSQPPSPKKHGSLGNLAVKSNSLPGNDLNEEDQDFVNYSSHRAHKYRSPQYTKYMGHSQDSTTPRQSPNTYYKNVANRKVNGTSDNHLQYNRNYASLERPMKSRVDRDRRPSGDLLSNDFMYYSLDRRNPHIAEDSNDSSYASLDRPMHKPPLPSGSIDDVSMASMPRRRNNSFSSQRSSSSYSSQSSSTHHQSPHPSHTPLHHTSSTSSRQSEYSVYTSLASLSPSTSFSSNNGPPGGSASTPNTTTSSISSSQNSNYHEPQAASMYTTSTPVHLQPKVQHAYGTGIATSKTHYTPAQPMTCEPLSRSNRPSQTNNRNLPRSYTPCIEDGSYQGDAGESLADECGDEMLSWLDDNDGIQKEGTLV